MASSAAKRKLYCYVDETGQDAGSKVFIVVAVIVASNLDSIRERLEGIEQHTRITTVKWHKAQHQYRVAFLEEFLRDENTDLHIYFLRANKPILYYVPTLEVLQRAIAESGAQDSQVIVCIDGLDKFSAKKFTNALRTKVVSIKLAKGARDESEPLIRLADRWAGCLRVALSGNEQCKTLVARAEKKGLLKEV